MSESEVIPYSGFAWAYDDMMTNVDYGRWVQYVVDLFALYNATPERVLDLACGTGSVAVPLANAGYQVVGIDRCQEMLDVAESKPRRAGTNVEWIQADMRDFVLGQPVDAALCLYDSINYALDVDQLESVFRSVRKCLRPQGLFIFDITTERNIVEHFHQQTFTENRPTYSYIWRNVYTRHDKICRTELTFFIRKQDGLFERRIETHLQKIFEVREIQKALASSGFDMLSAFDAWTLYKHHRSSDRINFTARVQSSQDQ